MILTMEHLEEQSRKTAVGFGAGDRGAQHIIEIEDVDEDRKSNQENEEGEDDDDA